MRGSEWTHTYLPRTREVPPRQIILNLEEGRDTREHRCRLALTNHEDLSRTFLDIERGGGLLGAASQAVARCGAHFNA